MKYSRARKTTVTECSSFFSTLFSSILFQFSRMRYTKRAVYTEQSRCAVIISIANILGIQSRRTMRIADGQKDLQKEWKMFVWLLIITIVVDVLTMEKWRRKVFKLVRVELSSLFRGKLQKLRSLFIICRRRYKQQSLRPKSVTKRTTLKLRFFQL